MYLNGTISDLKKTIDREEDLPVIQLEFSGQKTWHNIQLAIKAG